MQKSSFLCLCYILRAIWAGRCSERRYADHIFRYTSACTISYSNFQNFLRIDLPNQNPADVPDPNPNSDCSNYYDQSELNLFFGYFYFNHSDFPNLINYVSSV